MSLATRTNTRFVRLAVSAALVLVIAFFVARSTQLSMAQEAKKPSVSPAAAGGGDQVARGKYLVEDVAMCQTCHTPRTADGRLIRSQWLQGASVPYLSAQPTTDWPQLAPRIGGRLPATKEQMVTLLTTGIWITGAELRDPMPKFHMNRADAEAVVAYLQSVAPSRQQ